MTDDIALVKHTIGDHDRRSGASGGGDNVGAIGVAEKLGRENKRSGIGIGASTLNVRIGRDGLVTSQCGRTSRLVLITNTIVAEAQAVGRTVTTN